MEASTRLTVTGDVRSLPVPPRHHLLKPAGPNTTRNHRCSCSTMSTRRSGTLPGERVYGRRGLAGPTTPTTGSKPCSLLVCRAATDDRRHRLPSRPNFTNLEISSRSTSSIHTGTDQSKTRSSAVAKRLRAMLRVCIASIQNVERSLYY